MNLLIKIARIFSVLVLLAAGVAATPSWSDESQKYVGSAMLFSKCFLTVTYEDETVRLNMQLGSDKWAEKFFITMSVVDWESALSSKKFEYTEGTFHSETHVHVKLRNRRDGSLRSYEYYRHFSHGFPRTLFTCGSLKPLN